MRPGQLLPSQRPLAVCRELTKLHEEVVRGSAAELAQAFEGGARGEITVVVGAGARAEAKALEAEQAGAALEPRIAQLLQEGVSPRDVARTLARELGLPRREVYARVQAVIAK